MQSATESEEMVEVSFQMAQTHVEVFKQRMNELGYGNLEIHKKTSNFESISVQTSREVTLTTAIRNSVKEFGNMALTDLSSKLNESYALSASKEIKESGGRRVVLRFLDLDVNETFSNYRFLSGDNKKIDVSFIGKPKYRVDHNTKYLIEGAEMRPMLERWQKPHCHIKLMGFGTTKFVAVDESPQK